MTIKNTVILGAGTYGEVFLTYLSEAGFNIIGFFDDKKNIKGKKINGVEVLGSFEDLFSQNFKNKIDQVFCSIGENNVRSSYLQNLFEFGYETPNFIHSSVILNNDVTLGKGVYLLPGVIIMPHTIIDDFVIISMGSRIAHHTHIKTGSFISSGVNVGANILIKPHAFLGISSTVMTGVKEIGQNSIIGCGAVVIKDVCDDHIVAGVPAKLIKIRDYGRNYLNYDVNLTNYKLNFYLIDNITDIDKYQKTLNILNSNNVFYSPYYIKQFTNEKCSYFTFEKENTIIIVMPIFIKKIETIQIGQDVEYYDATSPYGFSGPLFGENVNSEDIEMFWTYVDNWYKSNNIVTEFIRFNLEQNYSNYTGELIPTLNNVLGELITFEDIWTNLKQKVRNNYRRAKSHGLNAVFYTNPISSNIINIFYDIYIKTMERNNADKHYYYSKEYFENLICHNNNNILIVIITKDNISISCELIIKSDDTLYSYLGGTLSEYFNLRPNDFLKIEVMKWGLDNNIKYYALGGGRSNDDGLYQYKKSFFPKDKDVVYYTGRKIINLNIYNRLVAQHDSAIKDAHELIKDYKVFFPVYNDPKK